MEAAIGCFFLTGVTLEQHSFSLRKFYRSTCGIKLSTRYSQGPGLITHYSQGSLLPKSIIAKVRVRVSVRVSVRVWL